MDRLRWFTIRSNAQSLSARQGRPKDMSPVKDLVFKDAYIDAARTGALVRILNADFSLIVFRFLFPFLVISVFCALCFLQGDGSMNLFVEKYDTVLKQTFVHLGKAEKIVRVKDIAITSIKAELKEASSNGIVQFPERRF